MLLNVGGVLYMATGWLEHGLEVRIDDEQCFSTILVLLKLYFRLFRAWHREHMEH